MFTHSPCWSSIYSVSLHCSGIAKNQGILLCLRQLSWLSLICGPALTPKFTQCSSDELSQAPLRKAHTCSWHRQRELRGSAPCPLLGHEIPPHVPLSHTLTPLIKSLPSLFPLKLNSLTAGPHFLLAP